MPTHPLTSSTGHRSRIDGPRAVAADERLADHDRHQRRDRESHSPSAR